MTRGAMLILCLALGCASSSDADHGVTRQPIIGGELDLGDPGVVGISIGGKVGCTGTLIAPTLVVTAAHCFRKAVAEEIYFGSTPGVDGKLLAAFRTKVHPEFDESTAAHDIAVVILRERAEPPGVPFASAPARVGDRARVVGFGITGKDERTSKRMGDVLVTDVSPNAVRVVPSPALPCVGDSGGPVFVGPPGAEELLGVVSHGDQACSEFAMVETLEANRAFLAPYLPGAASLGARCFYDENCASERCQPTEGALFGHCTKPCAGDADCPSPMACTALGGGERICRYVGPVPGALGFPCSEDEQCDRGMCARRAVDQAKVCGALCFEDDVAPAGLECLPNVNRPGTSSLFAERPFTAGGGGCAVTASAAAPAPAPLAVASLLILLGRRARCATRRRGGGRRQAGTCRTYSKSTG